MLVVSMSDFTNNFGAYFGNVKQTPFLVVDENGKELAEVRAPRKSILSRLFEKKDDTIDGIHKPSRALKAALRESKRMEKHPERYKSYNNLGELFEELGIEA